MELLDPMGRDPLIWLQQVGKPLRRRMHLHIVVPIRPSRTSRGAGGGDGAGRPHTRGGGADQHPRPAQFIESVDVAVLVSWSGARPPPPGRLTVPCGPAGAGNAKFPGTFLPTTPFTVSVE